MALQGRFENLMALDARQVLNGVYVDLWRSCGDDDEGQANRADIDSWCTCTIEEAVAFNESNGTTLDILKLAGEVMI